MPTTHPLVYAVLELRVPFSPKLVTSEAASQLASLLPDLPVMRQEQRQHVETGPTGGMNLSSVPAWRLLNVESTTSLIISNSAIVYETTRYPGFELFRDNVETCLAAICEVAPPVGYDRLGLRYVNEIRPEMAVSSYADWRAFVAPPLVESLAGVERAIADGCTSSTDRCKLETAESVMMFSLPQNSALTLRMANLNGPGVIGNEPLRRYQVPEPGPFHVVDFDGYWPREQSDIRPFQLNDIISLMSRVHSPVKEAFRWATTPAYRDEAGVVSQ